MWQLWHGAFPPSGPAAHSPYVVWIGNSPSGQRARSIAARTPASSPNRATARGDHQPGDPVALAETMRNDLQAAALAMRPDLRDVLELAESEPSSLGGIVSGSGPTVAFLTADAESALELQVTLSAAGYQALHVHGPVAGARIVGG